MKVYMMIQKFWWRIIYLVSSFIIRNSCLGLFFMLMLFIICCKYLYLYFVDFSFRLNHYTSQFFLCIKVIKFLYSMSLKLLESPNQKTTLLKCKRLQNLPKTPKITLILLSLMKAIKLGMLCEWTDGHEAGR